MRVLRQDGEFGWTEATFRVPDPRLQPYIEGDYLGWAEDISRPVMLRETPNGFIPMIFNLGPAWRVVGADGASGFQDSFLAGLHERYTLVESSGRSCCIQVNFTPGGALKLLGLPLSEIAHRVIPIEEIVGRAGRDLIARLREARDWRRRFALLEDFFLTRFAGPHMLSRESAWAWRMLRERNGMLLIGDLATELGWSRKRLIADFHREFGLTPKRAARVMRFERAIRGIDGVPAPRWAEIAADCGYYDQAHLNRDFRAFAGVTPAEYVAGLLPNYGVPGY
ncbi:MAG TPA: helix-turn-helix domain-containing protein [Stellaceae bacterium]